MSNCYSILHQLSLFTFFDAGLIHHHYNRYPRYTTWLMINIFRSMFSFFQKPTLCTWSKNDCNEANATSGKWISKEEKKPIDFWNIPVPNKQFLRHVKEHASICYIHYLIDAYLVVFYPSKDFPYSKVTYSLWIFWPKKTINHIIWLSVTSFP